MVAKDAVFVFFYGLFMDEDLLAGKGVTPSFSASGFVDDFALRIGDRATLVPENGGRAYGLVMTVTAQETAELYAEKSVADYVAEPVIVELEDGKTVEAACYNLPEDQIAGTNQQYAADLLHLATKLGFPSSYLASIEKFAGA